MDFINWLQDHLGIKPEIQWNIIYSILVFIITGIIQSIILRIIHLRVKDIKNKYYWGNAIRYTLFFLAFIIIAAIWIPEFQSLATFLGLLTAGLAVALKDPIVNLFAWIFILIRKPFHVGDRIQIGEHAGDVIDIRVFQLTLNEIGNWVDADQSTGRIIHIPNGKVFTETQANYTQGFSHLWNEIRVLVTFESDWEKAKSILNEIISQHTAQYTKSAKKKLIEASKKFMIFYNTLSPNIYTSVKESGVLLTIRYICEPRKRRATEHVIWEDILKAFAKHDDIQFAYPTQRFYYDQEEVKSKSIKGPNNPKYSE
jgi:small-conductance mechanosensitive channel